MLALLKKIRCAYGDLIVKSDQEDATPTVIAEVGKSWAIEGGDKFIMQNSPD